jgi:dolichol-phosphate mannosyltransferase
VPPSDPQPSPPAAADTVFVSVVVPVHNEIENLPRLQDEIDAALATFGRPCETLLVDDASTDGSRAWMVARARRADPARRVRPIALERQSGQSAAVAAGVAHAHGEIVVTIDGDGQNDPADIPALVAAITAGGADVAAGVRVDRADPWIRRVSSSIANRTRRAALGDSLRDIGCGLKAFRRDALAGLPWFIGAHRFVGALCQFRGARVVEVPVRHRPRAGGRSKYGVGNRLGRGIYDLIGVRWLRARLIRAQAHEVHDE